MLRRCSCQTVCQTPVLSSWWMATDDWSQKLPQLSECLVARLDTSYHTNWRSPNYDWWERTGLFRGLGFTNRVHLQPASYSCCCLYWVVCSHSPLHQAWYSCSCCCRLANIFYCESPCPECFRYPQNSLSELLIGFWCLFVAWFLPIAKSSLLTA